jgi:hypothetical protein
LAAAAIDRTRRHGSSWLCARLAHRLGFDLADGIFQRQAFPGDLGFRERRIDTAQLRHQGRAGALVQRASGFGSIVAEAFYGTGNERVIICHSESLRLAR